MTDNELSRPVRVDTIGDQPRHVRVEADSGERAALARRFGLVSLDRLEADVEVARAGQDIAARGRLSAAVVQSCVATAAPVPATIDEPFEVLFRVDTGGIGGEDEVEIGESDLDVIFYDGAMVDVGEAAAQTLALALDPYPRAADAAGALEDAGVIDESAAGPFGALAALKDRLKP